MFIDDLKQSILQNAIQGKLVDQYSNDEPASELLKRLKNEKEKLVKDGKILKKKETEPFYSNGNYPFDIPNNWEWVQLSDISIIQEGAGIRNYQYRDSGIQLFCVTNILDGGIDLNKKTLFISDEEYQLKYKHLTLDKGDIVTACSGGSYGKTAIYDKDDVVMLNTSVLRMRFFSDLGCNKYLYYITKTKFFKSQLDSQLSGMQPNFGYAHYSRIVLPLPPLEEQKRIVAKLDELMPLLDEARPLEEEITRLEKDFPSKLRQSILQYAIQGKLVEQNSEYEPASELLKKMEIIKKLPPISEDEKLFDIPNNWEWVRIGTIFSTSSGGTPNRGNSSYFGGEIPWLKSGELNDNQNITSYEETITQEGMDNSNAKLFEKGSVVLALYGATAGKVGILGINATTNQAICNFKSIEFVYNKYLFYFLMAMRTKITKDCFGGAQPNISQDYVKKMAFAFPPLEEQKRIVAKLDELMKLCDELEEQINLS